jgi:ABC-type transporter Mla MlaB component
VREDERENVVGLHGAWTKENLFPLRKRFAELAETNKDLRVDLEHVTHVDASFLGLLMLAQSAQKRSGHRLACEPTNSRVHRIFSLACSEFLLGDSLRIPA